MPSPAQTGRVRELAIRTRDPYALWYSGQREPVDGIRPRPPADLPPSIHYRHIGVVIFNTSLVDGRQGVTVAMHSGPYYAGHQHPDQNSFVIHAYGEKLAIDGGYYDWYGSPHFKAYSMQTLAHNTLLVDGRGQASRTAGADGRVAAYFDSPGYGYAVGDASKPEVYGGLLGQFDRRILFIKPGFVVVHDLVASTRETAKYDWMLHAIVPIEIDARRQSFSITCAEAALRGRFLLPTNLGMEVTSGFPVEPVNRYSTDPVPPENYFPEWHLTATPQQPTAREEFLAAMQIRRLGARRGPEAVIESVEGDAARGVRFQCGESTHYVILRRPGAEGVIHSAGLETDGEAAAIELAPGGKVRRAFAAKAGFLRYDGRELFRSLRARDWATAEDGEPEP